MPIFLEEIFFRHLFSPNNVVVFFVPKVFFSSHLAIMATGSAKNDISDFYLTSLQLVLCVWRP